MVTNYAKPPRTMLEAFKCFPDGTLIQLINNQLVLAKTPSDIHQNILGEISFQFLSFLKENKMGQLRMGLYDVYLSTRNVFQPDICFIANENLHKIQVDGLHGAPDLVIELLSPSTSKYDLDDKKDIYERHGVKEYFIVEPATKDVQHFWLENNEFVCFENKNASINSKLLNLQFMF